MKFRPLQWIKRAVIAAAGASPSSPPGWLEEFFNGGPASAAGVNVNERSALSASAVFACVRNIAEDTAKLPLIPYLTLVPRGKKILLDHRVYALVQHSPNPEMTAFSFRQALVGCAALFGTGYAEIERNNRGDPIALWPIENWRVRPRRDASKKLYYEIDGNVRIELEDMLVVSGFSLNGILGEMVTRNGQDSLGLAIAATRFAAGFFGNGARLSGVIESDKGISDKAFQHLRESFAAVYAGVGNSHKPGILEEGMKWKQLSSVPEEAQMLETRQFQVEDVARWFRMPPHKIGHLERAQGWSTLEAFNTDYVIDCLMPWFVRIEQEFKRKLFKPNEGNIYLEHLVDAMLRGDSEARADFYTKMMAAGAINRNEIRDRENMNPVDGGETYFISQNLRPADAPFDPTNASPPPADPPAADK